MRALLLLTRMRLLDVLRNRASSAFILVFPVVLLVITGLVFLEGHPFERRALAVVGTDEDVARARAALAAFPEVRVEPARSEVEAIGRIRARMASAVLLPVPGGGRPRLLVGPRDQLFGRGLAGALPFAAPLEVLDAPANGYVHYLFPGVLVFCVMASGLLATGHTLVLYRQNRFLKKLATTPLPKATFVLAQVGARSVLVLGQVALLVLAAGLLFGAPFTLTGLLWLLPITLLGLLAFMGLGFALACVITAEDLVVDIISGVQLPLILGSEVFFPLAALPRPLAALGEWLPSTEMVRLLRAVLLYGETDPAAILPGLAFLAGWTVLTFAASLLLFRWHDAR
jgi:ABC-2 type transport system permease protein